MGDRKYNAFIHSIPPFHFADINFDTKSLENLEN